MSEILKKLDSVSENNGDGGENTPIYLKDGEFLPCKFSFGGDITEKDIRDVFGRCAFAVYSEDDNSLIFYNDYDIPSIGEEFNNKFVTNVYTGFDTVEYSASEYLPWYSIREKVEDVSFDESFKDVQVKSVRAWFYMFTNCTSMDLKYLDTSQCQNFHLLFGTLSSMESLDVSSIDTSKVTQMTNVFEYSTQLKLLDLSTWDTSNVTTMLKMFRECNNLETIYSNDDVFVTTNVIEDTDMFTNCTSLIGGNGTTYDSSKIDSSMAHVDVEGNPGYFTNILGTPFAVYSEDDNSLTFYKDKKAPTTGEKYNGKTATGVYTGFDNTIYSSDSDVLWNSICTSVKSVSFDSSFASVKPIATAYWFYGMTGCASMELTNLDTSEVTDMEYMFYHCENVSYLNMNTWDTSNVTDMMQMLSYCYKIESFDLSNFNTSKVTAMNGMFRGDTGLTELNLNGFDTSKVIEINAMFRDSTNLKTIYANKDWDLSSVSNDANMFYECTSLVGGNGTTYDSSKVDSSMAHIDTASNPGYFTDVSILYKAFAVYSEDDGSLTFYADSEYPDGNTYKGKTVTEIYTGFDTTIYSTATSVPWNSICELVEKVSFNKSFEDISPNATAYWFYGFTNCKEIDLTYFNTSSVTSMRYMFQNCSSLTSLDVSSFNTSNVTNMVNMFTNCSSLTSLDVSNFNTESATSFNSMFYNCSSLTSLDVSNFNTSNVTNMTLMFGGCSNILTIYSNDSNFVTTAVTSDTNMFNNCSKLVGGNGTVYDSSHRDSSYAHIDVEDNPGYFTDTYLPFAVYG